MIIPNHPVEDFLLIAYTPSSYYDINRVKNGQYVLGRWYGWDGGYKCGNGGNRYGWAGRGMAYFNEKVEGVVKKKGR